VAGVADVAVLGRLDADVEVGDLAAMGAACWAKAGPSESPTYSPVVTLHIYRRLIMPPCRMMKKVASFVLVSTTSSMYPRGYTCGVGVACGLAGRPF
jgi:hypothetical protein